MDNIGIMQSELFYVDHIDADRDSLDIDNFYIEAPQGQGLSAYLKQYALMEEDGRSMRTYLVRDRETDECVGYFSLKAGLISLNETEIETEDSDTGEKSVVREFDTLPGVELANFAVNSTYVNRYPYQKGVGHVIFTEFIVPLINIVAEYIGVQMVYIFALPYENLISRYRRYGFQRLPEEDEKVLHKRLKPRYDESCRFMYLPLKG